MRMNSIVHNVATRSARRGKSGSKALALSVGYLGVKTNQLMMGGATAESTEPFLSAKGAQGTTPNDPCTYVSRPARDGECLKDT